MTIRTKTQRRLIWFSVSLSVLAICLLASRHWIEQRNDAEVDRIAAELARIESVTNDAIANFEREPDAVRELVKIDVTPNLESLKQRVSSAKRNQESPLSGETLVLYGALACIIVASCINLSFHIRSVSTSNIAGEQLHARETSALSGSEPTSSPPSP
jgi:hypothetical protein